MITEMDSDRGFQFSQQWNQCLAVLGVSCGISSWVLTGIWLSFEHDVLIYWLAGVAMIGAILGAVSADAFGRKRTLLMTLSIVLLLIAGLTFLTYHYNFVFFATLNVTWAFIIGVTATVVPVYISEVAGANIRANLMLLPLAGFCATLLIISLAFIYPPMSTYLASGCAAVTMVFHVVVLTTCPETPYYLNWKGKHYETEHSLNFYTKSGYFRVPKYASKPNEDRNTDGFWQEWKLKMTDIVRRENLRRLAIVFALIIIKWVVGGRHTIIRLYHFHFVSTSTLSHWMLLIPIPMLIFTIFFILSVNHFKKKAALMMVIALSFAGTVICIYFPRLLFLVAYTKFLCHFILVTVTLAQLGNLFPMNLKAVAIAVVTSFEILIKCLYHFIGLTLYDHSFYQQVDCLFKSYVDAVLIVVIFILVLTFFPKSTEDFSAKAVEHYSPRITGGLVYSCDKTAPESKVVTCDFKK